MSVALVSLALLAFIWIGYPTLMWVLARLRPLPRTRWQGDLPGVTIVVATRESAEVIQRRVADLRRSAYPADRTEIVVVIDAHADPEIERSVGAIEGVRVLRGPRPGKAASVNAGVAAARGEVVVFADSGQQFAPGTIGALVDALADERVGAASGRLELHAGRGPRSLVELYWAIERRLRRDEARVHSTIGVTGAVYAMRRARFEPLPEGIILDDLYGPMRLVLRGYRIAYVDDAVAIETRRFAALDEQRRKVRTLTGVVQLCRILPAVLVPVRNPVWFQFVAHKLLRFLSPVLVMVVVAATAATLGAVVMATEPPARWLTALAAGVVVAVVVFSPIRRVVAEFVRLNVAVVEAAINGVRGRWDVWR